MEQRQDEDLEWFLEQCYLLNDKSLARKMLQEHRENVLPFPTILTSTDCLDLNMNLTFELFSLANEDESLRKVIQGRVIFNLIRNHSLFNCFSQKQFEQQAVRFDSYFIAVWQFRDKRAKDDKNDKSYSIIHL